MRMLLFITFILFISIGNAQKKIKPNKLNEDFSFLIKELKSQHQGLYKYVGKNETDLKIDSVQKTLNEPRTKLEFYQSLRYVIGLTNEGHTSLELPSCSMMKLGLSKTFLPLAVKLIDGDLIVTQNYGKNYKNLKKGLKIVSVNDRKIDEILDKIYPLIPTDGFNVTSKQEWIGGLSFSLLYRLVYGKKKKFELQVQEFGSDKIQTLNISAIRFTKFKNKNAKFESREFDFNIFKFEQINDSIAYLSIPSFGDDIDYEKFYQTNFNKIDSLSITHLIIDIQANGGGTEGNENLLFSYLTKKVVQKYEQVTMLKKPYQINKNNEGYIKDKWTFDSIAKRGNYTLYSDYYSDLGYKKPNDELIYKGKLYVLISGKTFSGGAEFASLIKMMGRGVFIGEETGGIYEGNVSGYSEYIRLPHSKIEVKIPTVNFQINVSPKTKGRGIIPDQNIPQTWEDYLNEKNTKKDFIIQSITEYN